MLGVSRVPQRSAQLLQRGDPVSCTDSEPMTFSQKILAGLAAGIVVGLFFGEKVAPLAVVADGFVKLLQMTVLPYVTVSIIASLGSLDLSRGQEPRASGPAPCWRAVGASRSFFCSCSRSSSRRRETASFFSTSLLEKPPRLRLRRSLHSVQSVQLARQQHRPRGGAVLDRARGGADRCRAQGRAARRVGGGQRDDRDGRRGSSCG